MAGDAKKFLPSFRGAGLFYVFVDVWRGNFVARSGFDPGFGPLKV